MKTKQPTNPNEFEKKKGRNFFKVPHRFEEEYGKYFTPAQKYFFDILCKLTNRYGDKDGWFWHVDEKRSFKDKDDIEHTLGFETFGFSVSTCKRARAKFRKYDLVEMKYGWNQLGHRNGTFYRINLQKLGAICQE